ncbi:TraB/GumN family protein [Rosenbergiella collisarenosi]|uniref:TraB/GumN family protein n=1 Tax=Rosenbergiella collisarenosi TaxID=1544695 RepID=UPI00240E23FE|nr:TraB/GumN family protein [Rosenbergiella collisarenosi]
MAKLTLLGKLRHWLKPDSAWISCTCPSGEREFILVGSIHMGIPAMSPLPGGLNDILTGCDALVVEADITLPFTPELAPPTQLAPLIQQLTAEQWQTFETLCQECQLSSEALANFPAWQIGLTLQQKQASLLGLRPEFGVDYQLLMRAKQTGQSVIALESQQQQLNLLTMLPDNGLHLLLDSLTHWRSNARQLQKMIDWWLSKDQHPRLPLPNLSRSFSNDLHDRFIVERNQQWAEYLVSLPAGRYLVAVGALHLCGPGNLVDLLTSLTERE